MSPRTKRATITKGSERAGARSPLAFVLALVLALTLPPMTAATPAASAEGDGLYGKWDSQAQLGLTLGAGAHFADQPSFAVDGGLRLRFLDAFGPTFAARGGRAGREGFAGFELRPFGPLHFLSDRSSGRARRDLFLRSLGLTMGAAFGLDGELAAAFFWGAGIGVPLALPSGRLHGLDLRLEVRHRASSVEGRSGRDAGSGVDLLAVFELDLRLGLEPVSRKPRERPRRAPARP